MIVWYSNFCSDKNILKLLVPECTNYHSEYQDKKADRMETKHVNKEENGTIIFRLLLFYLLNVQVLWKTNCFNKSLLHIIHLKPQFNRISCDNKKKAMSLLQLHQNARRETISLLRMCILNWVKQMIVYHRQWKQKRREYEICGTFSIKKLF